MTKHSVGVLKVTVSLPRILVEYADQRAETEHTNRSHVIAEALAAARLKAEEDLAREGYRFYGTEAEQFAESSSQAVAEAIEDVGSAW